MSEYKWDFFLAHANEDKPVAENLYDLLSPYSNVFLDSKCLQPGDLWPSKAVEAQKASCITVVLISGHTCNSHYVMEEITLALDLAQQNDSKHRVVPVNLGGNLESFPYGLRNIQALSILNEGMEVVADRLLEIIGKAETYSQIELLLHGKIENFSDEKRTILVDILAGILGVNRLKIKILKVLPGSITVVVKLPKNLIELLRSLTQENISLLANIGVQTIKDEKSTILNIQPTPYKPRAVGAFTTSVSGGQLRNIINASQATIHLDKSLSIPFQLRPSPRDFTDRQVELEEILNDIRERDVTIFGLRGMGGIGKTALALRLAEQLTTEYPDGQLYLNLNGTNRQPPLLPAQAMAHVIRSYYPESKLPDDEVSLSGMYHSVLRDKRTLLLMDNAANADQITPFIPHKPCLLLVTSRKHFNIEGLVVKDLTTLPSQDACHLLQTIAPRIGEYADKIADACGYLPLALRLAADAIANRHALSPLDYLKRLEANKTQAKLSLINASISLSYALLTKEQQELWRLLAVFPDSFELNAAIAVWEIDEDSAQDAIDELIAYSLVECNETTKRYQLHNLVRVFADAQLSDEERYNGQWRHANHYKEVLALTNSLYLQGGENIQKALSLFDRERTHIETGQTWAVTYTDKDNKATQLCNDYPIFGEDILELRLSREMYCNWCRIGLKAASKLGDCQSKGSHLNSIGLFYVLLGDTSTAKDFCKQSLKIFSDIDYPKGKGNVLCSIGLIYAALGKHKEAISYYGKALSIAREINDLRMESTALGNMANAYMELNELETAIKYHKEALVIDCKMGDKCGEGRELGNLGLAYFKLEKYSEAMDFYLQHLSIAHDIGDRLGEGNTLCNLGLIYTSLGNPHEAIKYYEQSLIIFKNINDINSQGTVLYYLTDELSKLSDESQTKIHAQQLHDMYDILQQMGNHHIKDIENLLNKLN